VLGPPARLQFPAPVDTDHHQATYTSARRRKESEP